MKEITMQVAEVNDLVVTFDVLKQIAEKQHGLIAQVVELNKPCAGSLVTSYEVQILADGNALALYVTPDTGVIEVPMASALKLISTYHNDNKPYIRYAESLSFNEKVSSCLLHIDTSLARTLVGVKGVKHGAYQAYFL